MQQPLLRERPGPEQSDLAVGLNDLALAMHYHGELEAAEPLYREALEIDGRLLEGNGGRRSKFLNNLARCTFWRLIRVFGRTEKIQHANSST